jgi:ferritin-like protein
MASEGYHEPFERLSDDTRDMHRAVISLVEELQAVDWYNQRADACLDDDLRAILAHNRDEEKEHAAMVLEWIRRRDPRFDQVLRTYLFTSGKITELEEAEQGTVAVAASPAGNEAPDASTAQRLTVGSLLGEHQ